MRLFSAEFFRWLYSSRRAHRRSGSQPPLLNILDFSGDGTAAPLVLVQGGQTASTQGVEVTRQSTGLLTTTLPPLNLIMPQGFGGLSLVQTAAAVVGGGQSSPVFSL